MALVKMSHKTKPKVMNPGKELIGMEVGDEGSVDRDERKIREDKKKDKKIRIG